MIALFGKNKILVEIIGANGIKSRKKYPIESNKVVIRAAKRGRGNPAYTVGFDRSCILDDRKGFWIFKRLTRKLMLMEGADHCIRFEGATADKAMWDRHTEENLFNANVIKAAGATLQKITVPTLLYVMLFLIAGLEFISLLLASGRIRIG